MWFRAVDFSEYALPRDILPISKHSLEKFQDYMCREGERLRQRDRAAMGRN